MGRQSLPKKRISNTEITDKWVDKIYELCMHKGISQYSMNQIASKLDVCKATFYKYFDSRESLMDAVVKKLLINFSAFRNKLQVKGNYIDRYINAISGTMHLLTTISDHFVLDLQQNYPKIWIRVEKFLNDALSWLEAFYQEGKKTGELIDVSPQNIVLIDKAVYSTLINKEFAKKNNVNITQAIQTYILMRSLGILKNKKNSQAIFNKLSKLVTTQK